MSIEKILILILFVKLRISGGVFKEDFKGDFEGYFKGSYTSHEVV